MKRPLARLGTALILAGAATASPATELLLNGDFENGDLLGWGSTNAAVSTGFQGVTPNSGTYMARLAVSPSSNAALRQDLTFDTGLANSITVDLWYNLQALATRDNPDTGIDSLSLVLVPSGGGPTDTLFTIHFDDDAFEGFPPTVPDDIRTLGWTRFTETRTASEIPDVGIATLAFEFRVDNAGTGQLFTAYVDDVSFDVEFAAQAASEPAALVLALGGLSGVAATAAARRARRRRLRR